MTYIPTEWKTGDVITAERLNKAEQGIKDAHDNVADISSEISTEVASWLDEHVNVTEGVNIDDTLSVAGSAADAAKVGEELGDLKSAINDISLLDEMIMGTVQTISFDQSGNVSQITHSRSGTVVRTDVFTFGTNTITEVRTMATTGESVTIVTNTATLETTITHTAA